jgi:hypothetical protein
VTARCLPGTTLGMSETQHTDPDARLDQLEERIRHAREEAREALGEPDPDEPRFHESGSIHPELDDQTIAPPG